MGAFDTVSPLGEGGVFDILLNSSTMHMRHAVALNEDRKALRPELIIPEEFNRTNLAESDRSFVQAYFMGTHADLAGIAKKAGLGLYPLQWMVLEAEFCGLVLDVPQRNHGLATDPLLLARPVEENPHGTSGRWTFTTANGIVTLMQDIRDMHQQEMPKESYAVRLGSRIGSIRQRHRREIFLPSGYLKGYCDWAAQGTILHPSVYLLIDEHSNIALDMREVKMQRHIEDWRDRMICTEHGTENTGFWLDEDDDDAPDLGPLRVLVCGNTGVGKSTLINKTFGVDVVCDRRVLTHLLS